MKTRTKVILDAWFGKSAVVLLNILARILGAILNIDHSLKSTPRRIVVCKFLGMGSIIQATPLLQTLRRNFPDSEIIFVTSQANLTLLKSADAVNSVLCVDDKNTWSILKNSFSLLRSLWSKKADLYIDLETYSYYSTAIATLSCARNRFGFYRVERNIRMGVYTHMMFFNAEAPIAQSYLQMARLAGCTDMIDTLFHFKVSDDAKAKLKEKLNALTKEIPENYIIVNPNASDLRIERRWPREKVAALLQKLILNNPEKKYFLIGSKNEFEWVNSVFHLLNEKDKEKVFNTAGLFSLPELFALIDGSVLMITNDTGPMHISFSLGRPTVSLFGPASPAQYGHNPNAFGIYKNIYCSPCVHDFLTPPCKGDNQCMKQISVEEVFMLCQAVLSGAKKEVNTQIQPMIFNNENGKTLGIVIRD
jgi:ADP-heptose:LPS heptosyltransferase